MKCIWNMGAPCSGEILKEEMFSRQVNIPICRKHLDEHKQFFFINEYGDQTFEEYIHMSSEKREEIFLKLREKFPDEELET